jgi:hypothetical protein
VLARFVPVVSALLVFAVVVVASAGGPGDAGRSSQRLPDLDQEAPRGLEVSYDQARRGYYLGFRSAVRNLGTGPLIVTGRRPARATRTMSVDQVIERSGAPHAVVEAVGRLRYLRSPDHEHWHYLGFERYELRRPTGSASLVSDRKTGFCLGDRYRVRGRRLPARPASPVYTERCGLGRTHLLALTEGISVGYGDDYEPTLEGQSVRLTGLPDGRYVLVHRVNVDRRLRESNYANNAASMLVSLRWKGRPIVRALRSCPNVARCPAPAR